MGNSTETVVSDQQTSTQSFVDDVVAGLEKDPRRLPCKYFYDQRGSVLFDQICELDEYYVTRTEAAIMRRYAAEMGAQIGSGVMLVEYGSGSSSKTRLLLDHLPDPVAYVPVDISRKHLSRVSADLQRDYPNIEVLPVAADFTKHFDLPEPTRDYTHAAVYFPGSTIGNFPRQDAERLLESIAGLCGRGGGLLIGVDLDKDPEVLEQAYNDPSGITAEFNLNLLHRIRNELDATVDPDGFEHVAYYDPDHTRIEIYLRSLRDQEIVVDGRSFECSHGELIHTEHSHKYTIEGFAEIAAKAGFTLRRSWTDDEDRFAVLHFAVLD
jgi:dimethylhistidine N-methyltransferase